MVERAPVILPLVQILLLPAKFKLTKKITKFTTVEYKALVTNIQNHHLWMKSTFRQSRGSWLMLFQDPLEESFRRRSYSRFMALYGYCHAVPPKIPTNRSYNDFLRINGNRK
ncbi:hypothetical protein RB195_005261 [Necator americanus]|uniref:Uncharacterized protein n=1 Tax=Necator americanus TaxID=51031 RepID=A0ABR1BLZ5_NECAM